MSKNGRVIDDQVLKEKSNFAFAGPNGTLLSAHVESIFNGENMGWVNINNLFQYDDSSATALMSDASYAMIFGDSIVGDKWLLNEGYAITAMDIDARPNVIPRKAWLRFTKDNLIVDEKIINQGDNYTFYKAGQLIFIAKLDTVFAGATTNMLQLKYVRQYSESGGNTLIEFDNNTKKTLAVGMPLGRTKWSKGILIDGSNWNNVSNNLIRVHFYGIYLNNSGNNLISENTALSNYYGIQLFSSSNNILNGNSVLQAYNNGITLSSSNDNTISDNKIAFNNYAGITLSGSDNNRIFHNNFNNSINVQGYTNINQWDSGYPPGGNFWNDYTGADADNDGIGDIPYTTGGAQDNYPFMRQDGWISTISIPTPTPSSTDLISRYDLNHNSRIDRSEAVRGVMDYFDGMITRNEAVNLVMTYFGG